MKKFNQENFEDEVMKSEMPVIVDFYADWCVPCKMMAPVITQIEKEYRGKIEFGKLNIDECPMVALDYRVLSIPTLLFVKDGKVVGRVEAAVTKNVVEDKIKKYFGM